MSDNAPAISVTPARLGFFLALVSAVTVGWNAVAYFKAQELKDFEQDQRILIVEETTKRFELSLDRLSNETRELRMAVVKLTTVMEGRAPLPAAK